MSGEPDGGPVPIPSTVHKDMQDVNASLYSAVALWLKKHGKVR